MSLRALSLKASNRSLRDLSFKASRKVWRAWFLDLWRCSFLRSFCRKVLSLKELGRLTVMRVPSTFLLLKSLRFKDLSLPSYILKNIS